MDTDLNDEATEDSEVVEAKERNRTAMTQVGKWKRK